MFSKHEIKDICAMTPMQRGMLHHALLEPDSTAYHEQLILRLDGALNAVRLERAWQQVIDRHDALRGRFLSERVSNPVHVIPHHETIRLYVHKLDSAGQTAGDDKLPVELESFLARDLAQRFDLAAAHPMRFNLFQGTDDRHWLVWSFHHILLDGWSIGIVLDQVLSAYAEEQATPVVCGYTYYQRWLAARDKPAALEYWRNSLTDFPGSALLPPEAASHRHLQAAATVDAHAANALRTLAQTQRCSLHHLLLCAWALTLGRHLDQRDVVVPTVLAGRPGELEDADHLVGLLINTVPMRVTWQDSDSFGTLLQRVRDDSLTAARHQYLSMAEIQGVAGKLAIDHVLLVQGMPHQKVVGTRCGEARIGWAGFRESIPYSLEVSLMPTDEGIGICLRGDHEAGWLQGLADGLRQLLLTVSKDSQTRLDALDLISDAQRATLLAWGDGGPAAPHGTVLQAFDACVARTPDAPALVAGGKTLSYRDLDQLANRLAHALLADGPLAPDTPVALVSHRDTGLLAGLLAILRAGCAYVPVDPDFPPDRVRLMLQAGGCRHLLVSSDLVATVPALPGSRILCLETSAENLPSTPPACKVTPDQLAYVIFTSGSTGTPKGTMLTHANAASFFACLPQAFGFVAGDRILGVTTVSFDIAGLELLGVLCCGMTVVLASAEQARDPSQLLDLMQQERINVLQMTPTRLKLLLDSFVGWVERSATHRSPVDDGLRSAPPILQNIRTLLVGGEALPQALAEQLLSLSHLRVFNVYGPTETTIWSASWQLSQGPVSLGRALPGERLLILSSQRRLQPSGAIGEIAIAGIGVARGYLNDAVRTAERFISLPDIEGPVYLTGDLGRWRSDGSLEFLGRRDDQIKIRGMRIEIGEIEHHLQQLPNVQEAVAAARKNTSGETEIVAYLVGPKDRLDAAQLRTLLATHLPPAMIPSHFVLLAALPQTPNGKTDRRALPAPEPQAAPQAARAPEGPIESAITRIFAEVLARGVGPDDDFFLSGGHSLKAIQAIGRINRELASAYALRDLYRNPTAAGLVRTSTGRAAPITRAPDAPDYPLSFAQQALWVLDQMQPGYAGYNVPGAYLLKGKLDLEAFARAWNALVARHESLRTVFRIIDGVPRQLVLDHMEFSIDRRPPAPSSLQGEDSAVAEHIAELTCQPFNLATGPLFRIALIPLDAQRQILLLVTHHIISDGWSDAVMITDLAAAYSAALAGKDPSTMLAAAPALSYRDFAVWQHRYLASPLAQAHRDYWRKQLSDLPLLQLPTEHARSTTLARRGARLDMRMEASDAEAWLAAVSPRDRYATIAAATLALLHLESGQTDIVLGLPIANRDRVELQDQVGLHLNTLPLRQQLQIDASLAQLRSGCAGRIVEAMEHADYPFARLVDELGVNTEPGRHPVFDTMLIFHQHAMPVPQLDGMEVTPHDPQSYTSRFDLDFEIWAGGDGVHGFIEYDADLFSAEQVAGFAARWQAVLSACALQPSITITELRKLVMPAREDTENFLANSLALNDDF